MDSGYILYLKSDTNDKYEFNKTSGRNSSLKTTNVRRNTSRQQINTFGRVPFVYYGGLTNFRTFDLSTIFLAQYDDKGIKTMTAREYALKFIEMVDKRKPIVVENSQGESIICDVHITSDISPVLYDNDIFEYIEVSVSCTEIE